MKFIIILLLITVTYSQPYKIIKHTVINKSDHFMFVSSKNKTFLLNTSRYGDHIGVLMNKNIIKQIINAIKSKSNKTEIYNCVYIYKNNKWKLQKHPIIITHYGPLSCLAVPKYDGHNRLYVLYPKDKNKLIRMFLTYK